MIEEIKKIKKIELHIHLDGSVPIETLCELSGKSTDEIKSEVVAKNKCENLSEYLTKFDLPISYMQTKEKHTSKGVLSITYLTTSEILPRFSASFAFWKPRFFALKSSSAVKLLFKE